MALPRPGGHRASLSFRKVDGPSSRQRRASIGDEERLGPGDRMADGPGTARIRRNTGTAVGCKGTSRDLWNLDSRIVSQPWPQSTSPRLNFNASEIRRPVQMSRPISVA